ncbi:hypothetical protein LTR37_015274 [Vermiconidia calcicola]|uniref:Uncharacterized protein n=1 Tax=Vermiconidia calcicola TaxID=1690605 RepID=A0ACC3MR13_9PEZI|nr:hypothetical protein LTR37_015274 [Vermiconidia calcicola]
MPFSDVVAKYRALYPDIARMEKRFLEEYFQRFVNQLELRSYGNYDNLNRVTEDNASVIRDAGIFNQHGSIRRDWVGQLWQRQYQPQIDKLKFSFRSISDYVDFHADFEAQRRLRGVSNNASFYIWGSEDEASGFDEHEECYSGKLCNICKLLYILDEQTPKDTANMAARIQSQDGKTFTAEFNGHKFSVKGRWRDEKVVALIVEGPLFLLSGQAHGKYSRREQGMLPCAIAMELDAGLEKATPQPLSTTENALDKTAPQTLGMAKSGLGEATSLSLDMAETGVEKATPQAPSMPKSRLEEITPKTPSTTETDPLGRIEVHLICCHDIGQVGREHVERDGECWEMLRPVAVGA